MKNEPSVKKSVSMPESLWFFVERRAAQKGHGKASVVIQEAMNLMMGDCQQVTKRRQPRKAA